MVITEEQRCMLFVFTAYMRALEIRKELGGIINNDDRKILKRIINYLDENR